MGGKGKGKDKGTGSGNRSPSPNPARSQSPGRPATRPISGIAANFVEEGDDGEVSIHFELPQGKVEQLLQQLKESDTALKSRFPLAHTASVEAVAPATQALENDVSQAPGTRTPSSRVALPEPAVRFDPLEKLARLRELQERYSLVSEQRVKAEAATKVLHSLPEAGVHNSAPLEPINVGAGNFAVDAPAMVPPAFPPPGGMPFPYAGVPGVLEPMVKAPPEAERDIANGDAFAEDEAILDTDESSRLPNPDVLFMKDGLDMALRQLSHDGTRMKHDVNELGRRLDEQVQERDMRMLRTNPEVMDEVIKQQRTIHEQQRLKDELKMDIKLEDERQFYVEREQRQRIQRKVYGDRYPLGPQGTKELGYDSTPPELLVIGRMDDTRDARSVSDAGAREYDAMRYIPPHQPPKSAYPEDLPPTQMFRQNLLNEARMKAWPQAPTREARSPIQDDPGADGGRKPRKAGGSAPDREEPEGENAFRPRRSRASIGADPEQAHPDVQEGGFFAGFSGWTELPEGQVAYRSPSESPRSGDSHSEEDEGGFNHTPRSVSNVPGRGRKAPKASDEGITQSSQGMLSGLAAMVGLGGKGPDDDTSTAATEEEMSLPFCAFAGFGEAPLPQQGPAATAPAHLGAAPAFPPRGPAAMPQLGAASAAFSSLKARQDQLAAQFAQLQQLPQGQPQGSQQQSPHQPQQLRSPEQLPSPQQRQHQLRSPRQSPQRSPGRSPQQQDQMLKQQRKQQLWEQHSRQLEQNQIRRGQQEPAEDDFEQRLRYNDQQQRQPRDARGHAQMQRIESQDQPWPDQGMPPFAAFAGEGDEETAPSPGRRSDRMNSRKLRKTQRADHQAGARGSVFAAPKRRASSQPREQEPVSGDEEAAAPPPQPKRQEKAAGFRFEERFNEAEEDRSWGITAALGIDDRTYDRTVTVIEESVITKETPWEVEQKQTRVNPMARYMAGACKDRAPQLEAPDLDGIVEEGYHGVVTACQQVLDARSAGRLGATESAQAVLNYVAAVSKNADSLITQNEGSKHVSIVVDVLNFYPVSVQIHVWALEALVSLFRTEDHSEQESLSGPIFDAVTTMMHTYQKDKALSSKMPEMPRKILNALALVVTPATTQRLVSQHVDFALRIIKEPGVGPSLMEHGLHLLLAARIAHRMRDQAMAARAALRSFRAEPRLVTRSLLALAAAFEVAAETSGGLADEGVTEEADDTLGFGLGGLFGEEEEEEGLGVPEAPAKSSQKMSAVKRRDRKHRLVEQSRNAHKHLLEKSANLAAADKGLLADGIAVEDDEPHSVVPVGMRDIVTGMDLYAQDRKVQGAGAVALAAAVNLPGVSLQAIKAEGAVRALMLAQKNFPSSRAIALHTCQVMVQFARRENQMMNIEVACTALQAGTSFARDAEVVVAALQVMHAFALRLKELCPDRSSRLRQMSADLVRIGEGRHANPHALAMLLIIFVAAASNGNGTSPGGMPGEQWRDALAHAAAVVVPLRVVYEHVDNLDLVLTASIALRILTYGNTSSAVHVARLKGVEALLGTIQKHCHRAETARELLAALANIGIDASARKTFTSKLPDSAAAIYNALEKSAGRDPDVLAQGCRALGALTAGPKQDQVRFAIDQYRIDKAIAKASAGIADVSGQGEDDGGVLGMITGSAERTGARRKKLRDLCDQLINGTVATGPQFGRLISKDGVMAAEVQPRRRAGQAGVQERLET